MSDQTVDKSQTEPQDLSIKRVRRVGPEVDQQLPEKPTDPQKEPIVDTPIETGCDSTTDNQNPKETQVNESVTSFVTYLYELYGQSKSCDNFDSSKQSLTFKEQNAEQLAQTRDKGNGLENKLKHLAQYINDKTKSQINSYQMKDFLKE